MKKFFALLLTVAMVLTLAAVTASAEGDVYSRCANGGVGGL